MNEAILLRRDLTVSFPDPAWPEGIFPVLFSQSMLEELHGLMMISYASGHGEVPEFDVWQNRLLGDPEFDAELVFVAQAPNGALVGLSHCWHSAFLKDLVVHPDWRGRGLGKALLMRTFQACRNRYHTSCEIKIKPANTSAIGFCRWHGFAPVSS